MHHIEYFIRYLTWTLYRLSDTVAVFFTLYSTWTDDGSFIDRSRHQMLIKFNIELVYQRKNRTISTILFCAFHCFILSIAVSINVCTAYDVCLWNLLCMDKTYKQKKTEMFSSSNNNKSVKSDLILWQNTWYFY